MKKRHAIGIGAILLGFSCYIGYTPAIENRKAGLTVPESETKISAEYRAKYCKTKDPACHFGILGDFVGIPGRGIGYLVYNMYR